MFADDTNLFLPGINVDDLFSDMNCEINKIFLHFTQPQKKKKVKRTITLLENGQYCH